MSASHKLAVILFADMQGYTALMQKDEEAALIAMNLFSLKSLLLFPSCGFCQILMKYVAKPVFSRYSSD